MAKNVVWKTKVLSTYLFITAIWVVTQVLAHGNISIARKIAPSDITLSCAFADCNNDNHFDLGRDSLEPGSYVWLVITVAVFVVCLRKNDPGRR